MASFFASSAGEDMSLTSTSSSATSGSNMKSESLSHGFGKKTLPKANGFPSKKASLPMVVLAPFQKQVCLDFGTFDMEIPSSSSSSSSASFAKGTKPTTMSQSQMKSQSFLVSCPASTERNENVAITAQPSSVHVKILPSTAITLSQENATRKITVQWQPRNVSYPNSKTMQSSNGGMSSTATKTTKLRETLYLKLCESNLPPFKVILSATINWQVGAPKKKTTNLIKNKKTNRRKSRRRSILREAAKKTRSYNQSEGEKTHQSSLDEKNVPDVELVSRESSLPESSVESYR
eukprot:g373.t1